jgi:hypothetical protein
MASALPHFYNERIRVHAMAFNIRNFCEYIAFMLRMVECSCVVCYHGVKNASVSVCMESLLAGNTGLLFGQLKLKRGSDGLCFCLLLSTPLQQLLLTT